MEALIQVLETASFYDGKYLSILRLARLLKLRATTTSLNRSPEASTGPRATLFPGKRQMTSSLLCVEHHARHFSFSYDDGAAGMVCGWRFSQIE
jgi:hypothetical protein